jgi:hypothetical protein
MAIRRRWFSTTGQINDSYTTDTQLQLKEMTHIQVNTTVVITIATAATWPAAGIPDRAPTYYFTNGSGERCLQFLQG